MNFDAMRNLHAEQDQMDDSSGWKSAVQLADNRKLVRMRNKCIYQGGSTVWHIEFSKMAEAGSSFHMFTLLRDIGTPSIKEWDLLFLSVKKWPVTMVEVMFPRLGYKGGIHVTWDLLGMLALGTLPACY